MRFAIVLHGFAIFMIWSTSFAILIKSIVAIFLIYRLLVIVFPSNTSQSKILEKLDFQTKKWILWNKDGSFVMYDKIAVIVEAGIFFLLEFSNTSNTSNTKDNPSPRTTLREKKPVHMIFFDQMTKEEYRILRLLEKIS